MMNILAFWLFQIEVETAALVPFQRQASHYRKGAILAATIRACGAFVIRDSEAQSRVPPRCGVGDDVDAIRLVDRGGFADYPKRVHRFGGICKNLLLPVCPHVYSFLVFL